MSTFQIQQIRDELCHSLRNADIFSTTIRGVTTITGETWTANNESTHTLAHTAVKNIRVLTVAGVNKYYLRDYTMNWGTGAITWNTNQTGAVSINYDYGSGDKIFPDMPRDDLTLDSFPRVAIELTSISTEPLGLGGLNHISDFLITIYVWVSVNKDAVAANFGGITNLNTTMYNIRSAMRTNAKTFYTFPWITPAGTGPMIKGTNNKIIQQTQDYKIRFLVE